MINHESGFITSLNNYGANSVSYRLADDYRTANRPDFRNKKEILCSIMVEINTYAISDDCYRIRTERRELRRSAEQLDPVAKLERQTVAIQILETTAIYITPSFSIDLINALTRKDEIIAVSAFDYVGACTTNDHIITVSSADFIVAIIRKNSVRTTGRQNAIGTNCPKHWQGSRPDFEIQSALSRGKSRCEPRLSNQLVNGLAGI